MRSCVQSAVKFHCSYPRALLGWHRSEEVEEFSGRRDIVALTSKHDSGVALELEPVCLFAHCFAHILELVCRLCRWPIGSALLSNSGWRVGTAICRIDIACCNTRALSDVLNSLVWRCENKIINPVADLSWKTQEVRYVVDSSSRRRRAQGR
jgi:hypothetical protein